MFGYVLCLDGSQDRQQNLTAQRNHRKLGATRPKSIRELTRIGVPGRRLKEQSQSASSEHSSDSHELQEPSLISSYPSTAPSATKSLPTFSPILQSQFMDDTTMGDDITVKSMLPWTTYDSMISEMPLSTSTDFSNYPMSQGCTCNGVTGPCARHMDEIRYQTLNTNMSAPSQFMSPFPESHVRSVYEGNNAGEFKMQQQQQPQVTLHHQPSDHSFSASISSTPSKSVTSVINLYENSPPTYQISTPSSSSSEISHPHNDNHNHNHHHSPNLNEHEPTASDTTRFKTLLEAVNASGFLDFDCMVAAYYTASFEKSSVPAMAQRASRSRRLVKTLREIHESSERWPRWEARGFRESAMESARAICVDEIEKLAQHLNRTRSLGPESSASPSTLHGLGITASPQNNINLDPPIAEDHKLLAQSTMLPEDVEAAAQDEAPHLWAFFTELAGPQVNNYIFGFTQALEKVATGDGVMVAYCVYVQTVMIK
ncbi:hypothetical protein IMSHALPRED_000483 [Imshaugia aleurites]|uniref:Uncharacterized protein n=1 Tax=Imshaugia aleurites TaxID=172621 RepID=A0A8H3GCM0_9LECA|nr:hypothetical protein IMSHALPRED_000483 [Imshaugia aleurites]